jgi:hypothetical protein
MDERETFISNKPTTKEKGKSMKTTRINTAARFTGLAIALAFFAGVAGEVRAQEKGDGAKKLLQLSGRSITPKPEPSDYKPMSCAMCKDALSKRVDWTARGANKPTIVVAQHLCDGCGVDWTTSGHGKAKVAVATHKCTSCGAESLACCSTSKSGVAATKGMEKKFEVAPVK